jgi:hypothetical protein
MHKYGICVAPQLLHSALIPFGVLSVIFPSPSPLIVVLPRRREELRVEG